MAGIFGQTQVQEEGTPIQPLQPVADESAVTLAQGAAGLAEMGLSLFAGVQEAKAKKATSGTLADYQRKQLALVDALEQGTKKRSAVTAMWRKNYTEAITNNPELQQELRETSKFLATTSGFAKQMFEESDEEKLYARQENAAADAGWVRSWMTPEQRKLSTDKYAAFVQTAKIMEQDNKNVQAEASQVGLDKAKIELVNAQRRQNSVKNLSTLSNLYASKVRTDMQNITDRLREGKIDQKAAIAEINDAYSTLEFTVRQVGADAGGEYVSNLIKPLTDIKDMTMQVVTGKLDTTVYQNKVDKAMAMQTALMLQDPDLVKAAAASNIFKNSDLINLGLVNKGVLEYMRTGGEDTRQNTNVIATTPQEQKDLKTYFDMSRQSMRAVVNGTDQDPKTQQEMRTRLINAMKGVNAYQMAVENPADLRTAVEYFSSDEVGAYLQKYGVPAEIREQARQVFQYQYNNSVEQAVKSSYEQSRAQAYVYDEKAGTHYLRSLPATEFIEPYWTGTGMAFKLKDGVGATAEINRILRDLNLKPAKLINQVIKLDANLSGTPNMKASYEKIYERMFGMELMKKDNNEGE